jgi:hypothetical protein
MTDQQAGVHAPTENAHLGLALAVIASAQFDDRARYYVRSGNVAGQGTDDQVRAL